MYYQNYEDYMRSILGYPVEPNTYQTNYYNDTSMDNNVLERQDTKDLEDLYPDIFKVINPAIVDVCDRCNKNITKDVLEEMTDDVYERIKNNKEIMINVNIVNDSEINNVNAKEAENRTTVQNRQIRPNRRPNNQFLRDLIKILILNRLIGGIPNKPNRPPFTPMTPRPPYPGNGRPPMTPRPRPGDNYDNFFRF